MFNGTANEHLKEKLDRLQVEELRNLTVFLNLERSGEKSALVQRIEGFLRNPKDLGESKPAPKAGKASKKAGKVVKSKSKSKAKPKKPSSAKKAPASEKTLINKKASKPAAKKQKVQPKSAETVDDADVDLNAKQE